MCVETKHRGMWQLEDKWSNMQIFGQKTLPHWRYNFIWDLLRKSGSTIPRRCSFKVFEKCNPLFIVYPVPDFNNNFVRRNLQKIEKIREIVWQRKSASAVTRQSQIPAAAQALQSTVLSRLQYRRKIEKNWKMKTKLQYTLLTKVENIFQMFFKDSGGLNLMFFEAISAAQRVQKNISKYYCRTF